MGIITGSEGLLGVVTEITVRILQKPETARALMVGFAQVEAAHCLPPGPDLYSWFHDHPEQGGWKVETLQQREAEAARAARERADRTVIRHALARSEHAPQHIIMTLAGDAELARATMHDHLVRVEVIDRSGRIVVRERSDIRFGEHDSDLDPLHGNPRFTALLARIH